MTEVVIRITIIIIMATLVGSVGLLLSPMMNASAQENMTGTDGNMTGTDGNMTSSESGNISGAGRGLS
jgi:hypothetical protein